MPWPVSFRVDLCGERKGARWEVKADYVSVAGFSFQFQIGEGISIFGLLIRMLMGMWRGRSCTELGMCL